ncbi:hypothetical protein [Brevibacillus sp. AY1]|uniref:hypothetical protein n=1 Tax=Brevibacillus sp. AY1 TaxID=2807621 RepID=UPI0024558B3F|nr:hypothetical protein [Brevibacillus sp. AY1]
MTAKKMRCWFKADAVAVVVAAADVPITVLVAVRAAALVVVRAAALVAVRAVVSSLASSFALDDTARLLCMT